MDIFFRLHQSIYVSTFLSIRKTKTFVNMYVKLGNKAHNGWALIYFKKTWVVLRLVFKNIRTS